MGGRKKKEEAGKEIEKAMKERRTEGGKTESREGKEVFS